MNESSIALEYNFAAFKPGLFNRFWGFAGSPPLGRKGPDILLWNVLDAGQTSLHEQLKRHLLTVVEFGSASCPMSLMASESMEELADNYAEEDIGALFIYVREAHPGENTPAHRSFEQKLERARSWSDSLMPVRPIVVDSLDGACHRAYGGMPNMCWIFNRDCEPVYKSEWAHAPSVESAVLYQMNLLERMDKRDPMVLQTTEMMTAVPMDVERSKCIMQQAGEKALSDVDSAINDWDQGPLWPGRDYGGE